MRMVNMIALAGCILACSALFVRRTSQRTSAYAIQDLGTLGGNTSIAYAVNNQGDVVGQAESGEGANHAFLWSHGGMRDLGGLMDPFTKETNSSAETTATSINDQGRIVGDADTGYGSVNGNPRGVYHAVLWRDDTISDLGTLSGFPDSTAVKINATGLILGRAIQQEDRPRTHGYKDRTFFYKGGRIWSFSDSFNDQDVNDQGQGVGWRRRSGRIYVVLSNHQRVHELGPVVRGYVVENLAINNSGRIAMTLGKWNGENDRSSYGLIPSQSLVWQSGRWQKLSGLPSQPETVVSGMNSSGLIVGQTRTILNNANSLNQDATAVLWQNSSVKGLCCINRFW